MRPATPVPPAKSSRKGCLFGCLGTVIGVPVLVVLVGYYLVMHTSLPLRLVASAMEEDGSISIEGIGGSISRGFTVEEFRHTDPSGNQSVLEGLKITWGDINRMRKHRELVIEEISLRRAHLFLDNSEIAEAEERGNGSTTGNGEPLNLFEIKKVDIRQVVIESTTGDFKLELDEIRMDGLRIERNDFSLAALTVGSNLVDLEVQDASTANIAGETVGFQRAIVGTIKPGIHKSLIKEIDLAVELGARGGEVVYRARALNGSVEVVSLGRGNHETVRVDDYSSADYFAPEVASPVVDLSLRLRTGDPTPGTGARPGLLESGRFTLGTTAFTIAPHTVTEDTTAPGSKPLPLIGTAKVGDVEITATLDEPHSPPPLFRVDLSSQPERETQDLVALLWFGKSLAELSPQEADQAAAIEKQSFSPAVE